MLKVIQSIKEEFDVQPFDGYTEEQIVHLLQIDEAKILNDETGRGIYLPTPKQRPGVKKIASLKSRPELQKIVTYGYN